MAASGSRENEEDLNGDSGSEASSIFQSGSVISTVPDRHGFLGGAQYSPEPRQIVPPEVILRRERKWLRMLGKWNNFMSANYRKVRERCRKGIPPSVRPRAWLYLCGGKLLMDENPHLYAELIARPGDPKYIEDIRKDLHRQFPQHEMFVENAPGQQELFQVLKAYSILNSKVGYCQAQAPIAAFLLMHMPAVQAFWCLVAVCDKYLVGYYSQGMETLQRDGDILFALLKRVSPVAYKHLKKQKMEPILYMTEWFLCVYTRTLPWESILRVWDMFLCEGVKIIFKVGLVLLKGCLGRSTLTKHCPTMYETLQQLRNPPHQLMEEEMLVNQIHRLKLSEEDFEYEHQRQVVRRKSKDQAPPQPTMNGTD
ncbi:TBC1 domain family member whacked [Neodiprion pinetum]|uniref:TBC1 domain family member 10A n=1 Tax=Neodiprion lecontei TaxID=441921 RepID=A0A6J0BFF1_NEOLC|nr:TBC1 domain family member whacked [Neodiprion lecontei]XP_015512449.1 TBC1 domain family member whacked [Neodiprion lecontei]XP_046412380.1 TBC1 domain family member whacked [Neodiprion fabricii]XP_046412381.1 TBC1 domain family member whacked [Neodiprion fabricii]XP_046412382.1 TBC1 domain family member whacked [Neodiprion fabricii]XP_046466401.1 TBC1 domain family member whacked [Neodiprion pinetum]XP_046466402.1 TBC1 domain family member whacked [Neodiprion pinetum]XP_046466403.1 TBC1 